MEDFHGGFHPTHAVKAELGDPHYGFPPGKLVPACHTTSPPWKILGLAHCLNKVMKNPSLSASLLPSSDTGCYSQAWLFTVARWLPLLRESVLAQVYAKAGRAGFPAGLFLLGWKPFPEVPQPIHWPGLSQKPDTNCRRGWKRGLNGIFSSFSGNRSQPSQRKSSRGMGKGKGCQFVNYYGREVCHCS